jgi:uncharacterized membrane protein HdeD (DUF308 family)
MPNGLASGLLTASIVALVVLAPTVPDEPLHLSGVMVVTGLVLALLAVGVGIAQSAGADDSSARAQGRWVAVIGALTIVLTLGVLGARLMAQFS